MKNVENQIKEMMDLIKSTQTILIKGDLQESLDFIPSKFMNTKKT